MSDPSTRPPVSTDIVLLKLGGSLITDKRRPDTVRPDVLARLAGEIAAAWGDGSRNDPGSCRGLVLGHGSGSFGHAAAARAGVHLGLRNGDRSRLAGISATQERAAALHRMVLDALRDAGLAPFSIAPSSALVTAAGEPAHFAAEPVALALRAGLLPVVYGDVVMDRERGCAICSTESTLLALDQALERDGGRDRFRVRHALWAGATPGVLDAAGEPIASLTPAGADGALAAAHGAAGTDVTGGMLHRVEAAVELASRGVESLIFDGRAPGALARALTAALRSETTAHEEPVAGTRVVPDRPDRSD